MTATVPPQVHPLIAEKTRIQAPGASLLKRIYQERWAYLFIFPWLVLTVLFGWYPILASIRNSFYNWPNIATIPNQYVGFRHFIDVIKDVYFWKSVGNAVHYTVVLVPIQLTLALVAALVLNNRRLRFASVFRAAFFIPAVCSIVVLAVPTKYLVIAFNRVIVEAFPSLVSAHIFNPSLGLLGDPKLVMWTIIIFGIWQSFGYNLVFFLAALQSVPPEVYEAATVDGAGSWAKFWFITVPLIRPVGVIILFLAMLGSMRVFDSILALTNGGPFYTSSVPLLYIYQRAFATRGAPVTTNLGMASAASMVYSILLLGLTAGQVIFVSRAKKRNREFGLS